MSDAAPIEHLSGLTVGDFTAADEPLRLFAEWLTDATRTEPADPNAMVMEVGAWEVRKKLQSFTEEAHVSKEIFKANTLTLGAYFADYSATDFWNLGNTELMTYENRPRLVDVALNNGDKVSKYGLTSEAGFIDSSSWNGRNSALYTSRKYVIVSVITVNPKNEINI